MGDDLALSANYRAFLSLLNDKQAEYLIVGGHAVRYYGYLRETRDLDVWTGTNPENAMRVFEACKAFGSGLPGLTPEPFQTECRIIAIHIPPPSAEILEPIIGQRPKVLSRLEGARQDQIEIMTLQSGVDFRTCYAARVVDVVDGVQINLISLEDLKVLKRAWDRPKDLDDLAHLP